MGFVGERVGVEIGLREVGEWWIWMWRILGMV